MAIGVPSVGDGAPLVTTEGLGHRKILRDPDVVRTIVDFVADESEDCAGVETA